MQFFVLASGVFTGNHTPTLKVGAARFDTGEIKPHQRILVLASGVFTGNPTPTLKEYLRVHVCRLDTDYE